MAQADPNQSHKHMRLLPQKNPAEVVANLLNYDPGLNSITITVSFGDSSPKEKQNEVTFDFDLGQDTAAGVAQEMVRELSLSPEYDGAI